MRSGPPRRECVGDGPCNFGRLFWGRAWWVRLVGLDALHRSERTQCAAEGLMPQVVWRVRSEDAHEQVGPQVVAHRLGDGPLGEVDVTSGE